MQGLLLQHARACLWLFVACATFDREAEGMDVGDGAAAICLLPAPAGRTFRACRLVLQGATEAEAVQRIASRQQEKRFLALCNSYQIAWNSCLQSRDGYALLCNTKQFSRN